MPREHCEIDGYCGPEATETNAYLRQIGGDGYMGFPMYRVVRTSGLFVFSGGDWHDWEDDIPVDERGNLVAGETGPTPGSAAKRRIVETRYVDKYPEFNGTPGWLCERWMPPHHYGSPDKWESHKVEGTSIVSLGPFPHEGQYMWIGGPYEQMPSGPFLSRLVEYWEAMRDDVLSQHAEAYVRRRVYEAEERDRDRSAKWNQDASKANMEAMSAMFSLSLESGRVREMAARNAGLTGHYGN